MVVTPMEETASSSKQSDQDSLRVLHYVSKMLVVEMARVCKAGIPVYLPRLGFIVPTLGTAQKYYLTGGTSYLRNETIRSIEFEKCDDPDHAPEHVSKDFIELHYLAERIHTRLQIKDQTWVSQNDVRLLLEKLVLHFKEQLLNDGVSPFLGQLGHLIALHNRQGRDSRDWFAGADMFLSSPPRWLASVSECKKAQRPVLEYAWEPYEAHFNSKPDSIEEFENMRIALFQREHPGKKGEFVLTYVTDGFRHITPSENNPARRLELIFQLLSPNPDAETPVWPVELITELAKVWDQRTKCIDLKHAIAHGSDIELDSLLVIPNMLMPYEFLTNNGSFRFKTLTGITNDEADFARQYSPLLLQSVLERRGLAQVTKTTRGSVLRRSFVAGVTKG